jgi:hypothetical protein
MPKRSSLWSLTLAAAWFAAAFATAYAASLQLRPRSSAAAPTAVAAVPPAAPPGVPSGRAEAPAPKGAGAADAAAPARRRPAAPAAEPDAAALEARRRALQARLAGRGFTVVVQPPFVVVGDEAPTKVRSRARGFLAWTVRMLEQDLFRHRPSDIVEVWLFRDERSYRRGAVQYFGDDAGTPYGYYSPSAHALVMNIGLGAGTLSHELVHPYMERNFPRAPAWFNEGLASLYEQPRERAGRLWGTTNWRLSGLQRELRDGSLPPLRALLTTSADEFYGAAYDSYAMARFLCQYLQDHGHLQAFYTAFVADEHDPTGEAALRHVLGQDLETFEPRWRDWVSKLRR